RWEIPALLSVVAVVASWTAWLQARPGVVPGAGRGEAVDPAVLRADLVTIVGDGTPRVVGTPGAAAGRDRIAGILSSLGLEVERQRTHIERRAGSVDVENLVALIDGTGSDDAPAIAVVAHSDSVVGSPGASDDGAGVAALCAVARALVARPPAHDVLLLVTDGEERGLLGAQAFMAQHPAAASLRAVVNLDARGAAGPAAIFELGPQSAWLSDVIDGFVPAPRTQSLAAAIYERMPNGTDFTVFLKAGASGFNVAFIGDVAAYHRPEDTVERQSPWTRAHLAGTALGLVRGLDARWPEGGVIPAERAVFGDVLGLWVLRWPEAWTTWIVGVAALVLGAGSLRARINALVHADLPPSLAAGVSRSLVACLLVVVVSTVLG
ncbi:MAG: M28 family peptidase, partial [Phycisphaerales bacterium]